MFLITGIYTMVLSFVLDPEYVNHSSTGQLTDWLSVWYFSEDIGKGWHFSKWNWIYLILTQILTYSFIVMTIVYYIFQDRMYNKLDQENITDSDFSIMFRGLDSWTSK